MISVPYEQLDGCIDYLPPPLLYQLLILDLRYDFPRISYLGFQLCKLPATIIPCVKVKNTPVWRIP